MSTKELEAVKSRPILFNTDMVRAILSGQKIQTRRPIKPQPDKEWVKWLIDINNGGGNRYYNGDGEPTMNLNPLSGKEFDDETGGCPFGRIGDHLYVRETFNDEPYSHNKGLSGVAKSAANLMLTDFAPTIYKAGFVSGAVKDFKWEPSIHMPKEISRITLEVVNVRVEQLNKISELDAMGEGLQVVTNQYGHDVYTNGVTDTPHQVCREDNLCGCWFGFPDKVRLPVVICAFRELWDNIYSKQTGLNWDANPYVWVLDFKKL